MTRKNKDNVDSLFEPAFFAGDMLTERENTRGSHVCTNDANDSK